MPVQEEKFWVDGRPSEALGTATHNEKHWVDGRPTYWLEPTGTPPAPSTQFPAGFGLVGIESGTLTDVAFIS